MSYYGGGGGGWGHPGFFNPNPGIGPPPNQQPPPNAYFPPDASAYAQVRGPYDYVQPIYGSASHTHSQPVVNQQASQAQTVLYSSSLPVPPPQQQAHAGGARSSPLVHERARTSHEKSHDSRSPPRRHSQTPEDRHERRQSASRCKDPSPEEIRYRGRRSPSGSPERVYRRKHSSRGRSPELDKNYKRSTKGESDIPKEIIQKSKADSSGVNLDALLKDERLRNVLFAGISKATAKLEQSLKQDETKDNIAFHGGTSRDSKSQLFPSASSSGGSQQPRSILKRKTDTDESSDVQATLSSLTTLEKTLQKLRSKTDRGESSSTSSREKPKSKAESKLHGALGQLVTYDDDIEEEAFLYGSKERSPIEKKRVPTTHPFWSVKAVAGSREEETQEPDAFEMKDKMFEKWRQSIQQSPERQFTRGKDTPRGKVYEKEIRPSVSNPSQGKKDEELDSTVQNILHSIGFDFDLSQRMQQLARKKKILEVEKDAGISNQSASFLGKSNLLTEELKASLLQSGNDLSKIDSLLQEARASVHLERSAKRRERSPSPISRRERSPRPSSRREMSPSPISRRERSPNFSSRRERSPSPIPRRERSPSPIMRRGKSPEEDPRAVRIKERLKAKMTLSDWVSQDDEPRRPSQSRVSREYEAASLRDSRVLEGVLGERTARSALHMSGDLDEAKDEYFYPEKNLGDVIPEVPLLKSYSSRQKSEDLSGGLLKSMRVENFRVTSRPVYDDEHEEFTETRRIILPAKFERTVMSRSPLAGESRPPSLWGGQKRSGSPMSVSVLKERKVMSDRSGSFGEAQPKSPMYDAFRELFSPVSRHSGTESPDRSPDRRGTAKRKSISPPGHRKPTGRRRSPSPKSSRSRHRHRDRSRSHDRRRSKSPRRYRSRSPLRWRSRSPGRRRSRSPNRRRSRTPSPSRGHSRSRSKQRRSPHRFSSPLRRRHMPRRSLEKKDSLKADSKAVTKTSVDAKGIDVNKKDTNVKSGKGGHPPIAAQPDLSKLKDSERKAHLKKMLAANGPAPSSSESSSKDDSHIVNLILETFEHLQPSFDLVKKALVTNELNQLSTQDREKIFKNLQSRHSKVVELQINMFNLKKQQNELMRKIQRSGLGPKDSKLAVNERNQARVEKELERLKGPDMLVEVQEFTLEEPNESSEEKAPETSQAGSQSTSKDKTVSKKKMTSGNLINVPLSGPMSGKSTVKKPELDKATDSVSKTDKKKTPTSVTKGEMKKTPSESGKNSWTSVEVKDELPVIADEDSKKPAKKGKVSDSGLKATTAKRKIYYEYIDSGNHFCRHCHITCNTLSQFFEHCHGKKHVRVISKMPKPWNEPKNKKSLKVGQAQSRRIKGSEMLIPVTGFYCSLCKAFCGDLGVTKNHLKSDSHYDQYLDYIRDNPKYEKNLLLEKTKSVPPSSEKKLLTKEEREEKGRDKKAHLRVKSENDGEKEEDDIGTYDQIGAVDMELDEDDRDDDKDVQSKVPKMVPKPLPFVPPPPPEPASTDAMKTSIQDKVESLDVFLTIEPESSRQAFSPKGEKIPVVTSHPSIDLSSIPIPTGPDLPKEKKVYTVKSLREVKDEERKAEEEERKAIDEEKRMMGIDVDAEEEKPLAAIKRPPVLQNLPKITNEISDASSAVKSESKKTSVDNLFSKLNKTSVQKRKPKVVSVVGNEASEMELLIQKEILEKVNKEKENLLRKKQKMEERERRREERRNQKKKIYSSSESSSEESEEENEEDPVTDKVTQISLPSALSQNLPTKQILGSAGESDTTQQLSSDVVTATSAFDNSKNEVQLASVDSSKSEKIAEIMSNSNSEARIASEETPELNGSKEKISASINKAHTAPEHVVPKSDEMNEKMSSSNNEAHILPEDLSTDEVKEGMSSHKVVNENVSETPKEVKKGKTVGISTEAVRRGRSSAKKSSAGLSSVTDSDLTGVFSSSLETVSSEARKKLTKKGGTKKRGKKATPPQCEESEEMEIIMENFVILSEVTEEDEGNLEEKIEVEEENENYAEPGSDTSKAIETEKGNGPLEVIEVNESASLTERTLNQEFVIENSGQPIDNSKDDAMVKLSGYEQDSKLCSEKNVERTTVEEIPVQSSNKEQSEKSEDKIQEEKCQVLSTAVNQDVRNNDNMPDESAVPALSQEVPIVTETSEGELPELIAPTLIKEVSLTIEKDTENASEEQPPALAVPVSGRGGGRGRGKKAGGRGRGRGKRASNREKADDSPVKAVENPSDIQTPSVAHLTAISTEEEAESKISPSPTKRGRRGRAPPPSRRVTRSRVNRNQKEDGEGNVMNQPTEAVESRDEIVDGSSNTAEENDRSVNELSKSIESNDENTMNEPTKVLDCFDRSISNGSSKAAEANNGIMNEAKRSVESNDDNTLNETAKVVEVINEDVWNGSAKGAEGKESTNEPSKCIESNDNNVRTESAQVIEGIDEDVTNESAKAAEGNDESMNEPPKSIESNDDNATREPAKVIEGIDEDVRNESTKSAEGNDSINEPSKSEESNDDNITTESAEVIEVIYEDVTNESAKLAEGNNECVNEPSKSIESNDDNIMTEPDKAIESISEDVTTGLTTVGGGIDECMNKLSKSIEGNDDIAMFEPAKVVGCVDENVTAGEGIDESVMEPANVEGNDEIFIFRNEQFNAIVEGEKPNVLQMGSSITAFETDTGSLEEKFDLYQTSSEVGIEGLETTFEPDILMEDVQIIPAVSDKPTYSTDAVSLPDSKDGSDSDATITEDQEMVESQVTFDEDKNQCAHNVQLVPSTSGIEPLKSLEESDDATAEDSAPWDQTFEDGSDTEDTTAITVAQQDASPLNTHIHANQPRDPPMSGIVSDLEALDDMMDVDGEGAEDIGIAKTEADIPDSEGLPTSGLGLDLEDVADSISFPLDDENTKTDSNEPL